MYDSVAVWIAIVLGGVIGCLGLWAILNRRFGVPFNDLGGKPGKHLWSVIFMLPVPFFLSIAPPLGWVIALVWLAVAPSAGVKYYFGPKDRPWDQLLIANGMFAVIALVVYWLVVTLIG